MSCGATNKMRGGALALGMLLAALSAAAPAARAGTKEARCEIFEIKASNGPGGIDPALRPLASKLKRPPFSSWSHFEALAHHQATITRGKALSLKLVPGGKMSLIYRAEIQQKGKKNRLRLSFTLDDKQGKKIVGATVKVDSGDWYLIGGEPLPKGATYVLATSCRALN